MWGGSREAVSVNPSYHGLDRQTVGMCSILSPSLNCHGHRRGLLEKEQERMYLRCCSGMELVKLSHGVQHHQGCCAHIITAFPGGRLCTQSLVCC